MGRNGYPPFNFFPGSLAVRKRAKRMGIDWGNAFRIAGTGFGTVFLVLVILAAAILLIGLVARRIGRDKDIAKSGQKGE